MTPPTETDVPDEAADQLRILRTRAAVLAHFELDWLGVDADDDVLDLFLAGDARRVRAADGGRHWTLDPRVRQQLARRLGPHGLRAAWTAVTSRPDDPLQRMIDRCLRGDLVTVDGLDTVDLGCLQTVLAWYGPVFTTLPSQEEVERRLAEAELIGPFERLAGSTFAGRSYELRSLLPRHAFSAEPLMLVGVGGVGKSALLARHLLAQHARGRRFAYLTFDSSALDVSAPGSLIAVMAEQLIAQGLDASRLERLVAKARETANGSGYVTHSSRSLSFDDRSVYEVFGLLRDVLQDDGPSRLLVVLDTVEVVQRQGRAAAQDLSTFISVLSSALSAEVLLAGRAPLGDGLGDYSEWDVYELTGLDRPDARHLLRVLLVKDVPDADLDRLLDQFGTRPLTLRLVAQVLGREHGDDALRDLAIHRELIDSELYRRFLAHIPDEDVQHIAHPGLTLRRVTADLILHVLAKPCQVAVPNEERAWELFNMLALEGMLVEHGRPGELVHRWDVRQIMLPWLTRDMPDPVAEIHRNAITYFARLDDLESATEEVYHRLMLGQPAAEIDRRWRQAMLPDLRRNLDELPPASQAYLAANSGDAGSAREYVDVDDRSLAVADVETRRSVVVNRVTRLVQQGDVASAAEAIRTHRQKTSDGSLEIDELDLQLHELRGDTHAALALAFGARSRAAASGDAYQALNFTVHAARLLERGEQFDDADALLEDTLGKVASSQASNTLDLLRLTALASRLRLARKDGREDQPLVDATAELYDDVGEFTVLESPGLLRDLAAELGEHLDRQQPATRAVSERIMQLALRTHGLTAPSTIDDDTPGLPDPSWSAPSRSEYGSEVADLIDGTDERTSRFWSQTASKSYQTESEQAVQLELDDSSDVQAVANRWRARMTPSLSAETIFAHWPVWSAEEAAADLGRYIVPDVVRRLTKVADSGPGAPVDRLRQAWDRLREMRIQYAGARLGTGPNGQPIRSPAEVLRAPRSGTCLDIALVLAGALEATGLSAAVILLDPSEGNIGHAVVAISLDGTWPDQQASPTPVAAPRVARRSTGITSNSALWQEMPVGFLEAVRVNLRVPSGNLVVIDPVGLTQVPGSAPVSGADCPVEDAVRRGHEYLTSGRWTWRLGVPHDPAGPSFVPANVPDLLPVRTELYREPHSAETPLRLLRAEYQITQFQARSELTVLEDFCEQIESGRTTGIAVLTGVGGAGKTRLGLKLCEVMQARGWYAGVVIENLRASDGAAGELPDESIRWLGEVTAPLLIMVDYADARTELVQRLLRTLQQRQGPPAVVLLTGRSNEGQWLRGISDDLTTNQHPVRIESLDLADAHPQPERIFRSTADRLLPEGSGDALPELPTRGWNWTTLDLVLLGWSATVDAGPQPTTRGELYDQVLTHEEAYWVRSYRSQGDDHGVDRDLLSDAVACLSLFGPMGEEATRECLRRVPDLATDGSWRRRVARALTTCLDPGAGEHVALRPDPVGDHHLLKRLTRSTELRTHLLSAELADEELVNPLIALNRAGQSDRRTATSLIASLIVERPQRWELILDAASALRGPCEAALGQLAALPETPLPIDAIANAIPFEATGLWQLGLDLELRQLTIDREAGDPRTVAARLLRVSQRRGLAGDRARALAAIEEAVALRRALAGQDRAAFTPGLAGSLNNLSVQRSDSGDRAGALAAIEEAVTLRRALAEANPAAFTPELAASLNNLSNQLSDAGDRTGALAAIEEAVTAYQALADENLAAFTPNFASMLNNLSNRRRESGDRTGALAAIEEAVTLRRALAEANPAAFTPELAASLNNLSNQRSDAGDRTGALAAIEEAVTTYQALADENLAAFTPELASSLNNLSNQLSYSGDRTGALAAIEEAVILRRALAEENRAAFTPDLASSLNNLSNRRSESGDRTGALAAIEEAVILRRALAEANPAAFTPDLASSLNNLSNQLSGSGDRTGALAVIEEAVIAYRALAEANPAAFTPKLAGSLNNLSNRRSESGDRTGALAAVEEAVTAYQALAEANPIAFTPVLAASLNNLSVQRSDSGDRTGALVAVEEAVTAYQALAAANPAAFTPDLATSLNNLSNQRSNSGDRSGALAAVEDAVTLHRALAEENPAAFTPNLAGSLNNLSNQRSDAGDQTGALAAIKEAVTLHRVLAEANPAAFTPELASSLNNLSNQLSDAGDRTGALAAIEEAVVAYQALAEENPAAFTPNLAGSLNNLSNQLSDAGDQTGALNAIEEAVNAYRALADANPAAFSPNLATTLNNLSNRRRESGDRIGALAAIEEAVTAFRVLTGANPVAFTRGLASSTASLAELSAEAHGYAVGGRAWIESRDAIPVAAFRAAITARAAAWHAAHGYEVTATELLRTATAEAETDGHGNPISAIADSRQEVRSVTRQLIARGFQIAYDLPIWSTHEVTDAHKDLVNAVVAGDLRNIATRINNDRDLFMSEDFAHSLDVLAFLHPTSSGLLLWLRSLYAEAGKRGLDQVLADIRANHARRGLIEDWVGQETWSATFEFLRAHLDALGDQRIIQSLESSGHPLAMQHAAILRLVGDDFTSIATVEATVLDPELAAESALRTVDSGDPEMLVLLAQAQPQILTTQAAPVLAILINFAQGDEKNALDVARRATLNASTRKAHLVHLGRFQRAIAPRLTADGSATLDAIVAAYAQGPDAQG